MELRAFAEEQAALRRVATLVARAASPDEVFAAVTAEVGHVLSADFSTMSRYDAGRIITIVGQWTSTGAEAPVAVGTQLNLGGRNATTLVFDTGRPARIDYSRDPSDPSDPSGPIADAAREWGFSSAVGVPIDVAGRLWGSMTVGSARERTLPTDTEVRLSGFTKLVATAIANAEARTALTASRLRIVAAADATRRRIERDLHDGAQQRLVSLALHLRSTVRAAVPPGADEVTAQLDGVAAEIVDVVDEMRELARGMHPAALADGGLRSALKTLALRSAVPVHLDIAIDGRLPEPIELAAYYVVAEALTNSVKHAHATAIDVEATAGDGMLRVGVRDDGRGGADPTSGSGLVGLTDRVEALGGLITVTSPSGGGTALEVVLPLPADPGGPLDVTGLGRAVDLSRLRLASRAFRKSRLGLAGTRVGCWPQRRRSALSRSLMRRDQSTSRARGRPLRVYPLEHHFPSRRSDAKSCSTYLPSPACVRTRPPRARPRGRPRGRRDRARDVRFGT